MHTYSQKPYGFQQRKPFGFKHFGSKQLNPIAKILRSNKLAIQRQTDATPLSLEQERLNSNETTASTGGEPVPDNGEAIAGFGDGPASDPMNQTDQEMDAENVQLKASSSVTADSSNQPARIASILRGGETMAPHIRAPYEAFFGHDFSNVKIHRDNKAQKLSRDLGAQAFTVGDQVAFGASQYAPNTDRGQRLLAHELTHVVQQSQGLNGRIAKSGVGSQGDEYEVEADQMSEQFSQSVKPDHSNDQSPSPLINNSHNKSIQRRSLANPQPQALQLFSGSKAASYARRYAENENSSEYARMSNDCTNFVSQAMFAGGWTMKRGWYRSDSVWWYNSSNASWTWGGAHNFSKFIGGSGRGSSVSHVMNLRLGDVLQMTFSGGHINHSMVVTKKTANNLYLSYHTRDTLDRNFYGSEGIYDAHKSNSEVKYYGWNVK